jgi:hypothetical protein
MKNGLGYREGIIGSEPIRFHPYSHYFKYIVKWFYFTPPSMPEHTRKAPEK